MQTVKDLRKLIENLPDDMLVMIVTDVDHNEVKPIRYKPVVGTVNHIQSHRIDEYSLYSKEDLRGWPSKDATHTEEEALIFGEVW